MGVSWHSGKIADKCCFMTTDCDDIYHTDYYKWCKMHHDS